MISSDRDMAVSDLCELFVEDYKLLESQPQSER